MGHVPRLSGCRMSICVCGHSIGLHGRRGFGACRHGRGGGLFGAVRAARMAAVQGLSEIETERLIDGTMYLRPCECRRFRRPK